jgi:prevent-host-death family protein
MDVSMAEAKNRFTEVIWMVADGEQVVLTRHGRSVAQIAPPPPEHRKARLDRMKGKIRFLPGWMIRSPKKNYWVKTIERSSSSSRQFA